MYSKWSQCLHEMYSNNKIPSEGPKSCLHSSVPCVLCVWDTAMAKGQAVMHSLLPISCHQTIEQSLIKSICSVSFPGLFDWIEVQPIRSLQQKQLWGGVRSQALKEWATFSAPGHDDDAQTINSNMEVIIERERERTCTWRLWNQL